MSPEQAVNIVKQVKAAWTAPGTDHDNFGVAINVLEMTVNQYQNLLKEKNENKKEASNEPAETNKNQAKS